MKKKTHLPLTFILQVQMITGGFFLVQNVYTFLI